MYFPLLFCVIPGNLSAWVSLVRLAPHFLISPPLSPFYQCPLPLPHSVHQLEVSSGHHRWSWYWGLGRVRDVRGAVRGEGYWGWEEVTGEAHGVNGVDSSAKFVLFNVHF